MTTSIPVIPYAVRFCGFRISASHLAIIIHKWQIGLLDLQYWKHIASWCIRRLVIVLLKVESLAHSEILGALDLDGGFFLLLLFSINYVSAHCFIPLSLNPDECSCAWCKKKSDAVPTMHYYGILWYCDFRIFSASIIWQALWRCWFLSPVGLGI